MSWFGNRNREGYEAESPEVKPRNQILQTPEKETPESKGKLDRFQDKSPEEQKQSLNEQSQAAKDRQKLDRPDTSSNEGDSSKGQRQLERGHETEHE
jgi:hypothetical protein